VKGVKVRPSFLITLAALAVVGYAFWNYQAEATAHVSAAAVPAPHTAPPPASAAPAQLVATKDAPANALDVERLTLEATGADAGKRAAAIAALAQAPVEQALPVLRRVLMNGEPAVDRPLALRSLRDLALNRGDPQSAIRNAIREAIYHGDDQTMAADAQEALDVIEESLLK
jgi:hypothetical protein